MQNSKKICHNRVLRNPARVVKLVDAGDSKSPAARRAGSIPAPGTRYKSAVFQKTRGFFFFSSDKLIQLT